MFSKFQRFDKLFGKGASELLSQKNILIFGLGGVGSICCEALIRSGVGRLTLVDFDTIDITNLNRQIQTNSKNIGCYKTDELIKRLEDINPNAKLVGLKEFFSSESKIIFNEFDYVIDAIDSVQSKVEIIKRAKENGVRVISAMGAGNKIDPTKFEVTYIEKTHTDPLAKVMRKKLKDLGIKQVKCVFSSEYPKEVSNELTNAPGSCSFVPPVMGLVIASEVIKDLLEV
ncbi:tRNA threonylcarbamoyladenosine dehydratase [Citroniella saccharovorans]|uniref:tRNA threonylcarbamoyladenosine dehydratase n=1 Tax=Citroniella saccharovorans TaxID=2053367 RepID=A0AAW9MPM7_9FIRM|nr:tRNA threonylcarbamoyladenosine dehydratase [Citroniella saccharovorans]MEB3429488.1 tRNA threonylcarbamoyladenosine dehydratase [Citroniella saccharovorans]